MTILILHWGTRGGGPQMQARLCSALSKRTDVDVVASYDRSSEVASGIRASGVPAHLVGRTTPRGKLGVLGRAISQVPDAFSLLRFSRSRRVTVVYEVMDHPLQLLPRLILKASGVKVLASVHDAVRHRGEEGRVMDLAGRLSQISATGIMTYSATVAEQVRATVGSKTTVFQTVHGAFGTPLAEAARPWNPEQGLVVGFFGRIERYKGLPRLLEAVGILRESGEDVRLQIHGRGKMSVADRERARDVSAEVHSGWVAENDIQNIVSAFDVLALPYDEASQSGVVGYALSSGVPIICTPVAGLEEQVRESGSGVVASGMEDGDFAAAIRVAMSDAGKYAELSENALGAAKTRFSWDRVAEDIVTAARVISGRDGGAL